jgi:small-conductance mechanosensitive channel
MVRESFGSGVRTSQSSASAAAGLVILGCALAASILAQDGGTPTQVVREGVPVVYRGQEVLRIYRGAGALGPAERARLTSQRLNQLVRDLDFDPALVTVTDRETYSELVHGDSIMGVITDEDAAAVGRPRSEYAREVRDRLVEIIGRTREEFSAWAIAIGLGWAVLATGLLAVLWWLLARVRRQIHARVEEWLAPLTDSESQGAAVQKTRVGSLLHGSVVVMTAAAAVALVTLWVQAVLQVLPWSRPIARTIYRYASAPLRTLWLGFQSFVPNLFYLAVIALTTFVVLKIVRVVFREIEVGNLRLASFPREWAEPTYKLVRALMLAVAFVGAFPYIPGSQSPAFQGVSLFLGFLVSLSAGSALSNIIAGTILTYTRAFRVGDVVRIGETFGEVTLKRLLVTHVRTYKNVVVSIPNSLVLTTQVLNYSTLAAERGLIAHTSVTIGYDTPWRRVHELLVAAASRTEGVLEEPPPFVLQTALTDFSVTYEINAFVATASDLPFIYSVLHANIQECFSQAGVEIMSPNYLALRDGNQATMPRQHLPPDDAEPALRVRLKVEGDRDVEPVKIGRSVTGRRAGGA